MSLRSIRIEPVRDLDDAPALASIFATAIQHSRDGFYDFVTRYFDEPPWEPKRIQHGIEDKDNFVFKAVEERQDDMGNVVEEKIVGFSQWFIGYISIPKVEPMNQEPNDEQTRKENTSVALSAAIISEDGSATKETESEPSLESEPLDLYDMCVRPMTNAYITFIRGKRHVWLRRIAVLPECQRRGIATQLLQWGVDQADQGKIVAWLNARPGGQPMYEKAGWKPVWSTEITPPGMTVAPIVSMMRNPVQRSG